MDIEILCYIKRQIKHLMSNIKLHKKNQMVKTKHYCSRIQQRGVLQSTVDLAISCGIKKGDKFILSKKQLKIVLFELDQLRKKLIKAMDQGGIIAVQNDGCLITTYRINSFNQKFSGS